MPFQSIHRIRNHIIRICLLFLILSPLQKGYGQISTGTWTIGGVANFSYDKKDQGFSLPNSILPFLQQDIPLDSNGLEIRTTTFSIIPEIGAFVNDRWLTGANLGISYRNFDIKTTDNEQELYLFNVGAFLRRYFFFQDFSKGGLTATFRFAFQLGESIFKEAGTQTDDSFVVTFAPFIDVGIFYFITPHIAIETNWFVLGYDALQTDANQDNRPKSLQFNAGIDLTDLTIGIRWYLYH